MAVALANDPVVVLADEPTGELDGDTEAHVLAVLRDRASAGTAILIASHSAAVVAIADRIITLTDGRSRVNGSRPAVAPALLEPDDPAMVRVERAGRTYGTGAARTVAVRRRHRRGATARPNRVDRSVGFGEVHAAALVAGLDTPTSGTVTWPGIDARRRRPAGRIGVVFQGPSLLPTLDVTENVCLPLLFRDVAESVATTRARTRCSAWVSATWRTRCPTNCPADRRSGSRSPVYWLPHRG